MAQSTDGETLTKRGPRPKLSQEKIIHAALDLLSTGQVQNFTLAALAKKLRVGTMSLYTYFPSREQILLAVSDYIYAQFEMVDESLEWEDVARQWCWATVRLFDRYPIAIQLSQWDGHISPAWLKTWLPVVKRLQIEQADRRKSTLAISWFTNIAMGFITAQMDAPSYRKMETISNAGEIPIADIVILHDLWGNFAQLERDDILAFGIENIIDGLRKKIMCQD